MEHYADSLVRLDRQPSRASLRSFGFALAVLCFARALSALWVGQPAWSTLASCGLGLVAAASAWLRPNLLRGLYVGLSVLSYPVRWLAAFTILALVYFAVITPLAWLYRITRRGKTDALEQREHSAWHACKPRGDKAEYFRQF